MLAPLQLPFDDPSYGAARVLIVAIGLGGVAAAWWLGRSAYGTSAGVLAGAACAVATVHVVYSHMAVTDVLLTTCVTVSLALLVTGRLEWAGVAAGLAASAKYPGILLAVRSSSSAGASGAASGSPRPAARSPSCSRAPSS